MFSLLKPDLLYIQSATAELSTTSQTCEKKQKALVWQYCCCPTADKKHQDCFYCSYCLSNSTADRYKELYSSTNLTNIGKHVLGAYQIVVKKKVSTQQAIVIQQLKQFYYQAQAISKTNNLDIQILKDYFNKAVITKALTSLIVVQNLAYAIVKQSEFYILY